MSGEQPLCVSQDHVWITSPPDERLVRDEEQVEGELCGQTQSGDCRDARWWQWEDDRGWRNKRGKNGGVEGTVSGGLCASLPVCVNQQAAHGCNEVENKKNIKMSKWNKRQGEIFYDEPKFSLLCSRSTGRLSLSSPDTVHHPTVCIKSQITQITPPAIHVIHM